MATRTDTQSPAVLTHPLDTSPIRQPEPATRSDIWATGTSPARTTHQIKIQNRSGATTRITRYLRIRV
jgi:hypothetical protein